MNQKLLAVVFLMATGCASLPEDYHKTKSSALPDPESTSLGADIAAVAAQHPGESGFALLRYGRNAFNLRVALSDLAEKTLDVQVYIWEADETGRIFTERLLRAADRGVRVRVLVDDLGLQASDEKVAGLDAHPNIEVRIFNPFANRDTKFLDFVFDLDRVNNRMHNKTVIVDNSAAIVGGRNLGDHYFGVNPDTNFRDLDIAAIGPIVRDISTVFDHFWRGDWAVPIAALVDDPPSAEDAQALFAELRTQAQSGNYPYDIERDQAQMRRELAGATGLFTWARGQIVWDDPAQQESLENTAGSSRIISNLFDKLEKVQTSFDVESAYFVLSERSLDAIRDLVDRGVSVRVLTNSLASNDVLAAHAGHALYREEMLQAGAELYELRPDSVVIRKTWEGEPRAGLHTKALVFDGESLFVGSFNLDPRSANINTEAGLYVDSRVLAAQLLEYMEDARRPENAYRVELDESGELVWTTREDGVEVQYDVDPHSTWGQRMMSRFIGILPVESQL
jgi:putative cardiolipin synthase